MAIKKLRARNLVLALALVGAFAGVAFALVSFNPADGTGFVGKGDVQTAFGWNDKLLTQNVGSVDFFYAATQTHQWDCVTRDKSVFTKVSTETTIHNVADEVAYQARKSGAKDITGFNLLGYTGEGESSFSHGQPNQCGEGTPFNHSVTQGAANLYVSNGTNSVPIYP
jgi:hypothetical protein